MENDSNSNAIVRAREFTLHWLDRVMLRSEGAVNDLHHVSERVAESASAVVNFDHGQTVADVSKCA